MYLKRSSEFLLRSIEHLKSRTVMRMKGTGKSVKKRKKDSDLKENVVFNIQSIIMSVLMAITLVTIVTLGFLLYQRFKLAIDKMAVSNPEATVESTVDRVNSCRVYTSRCRSEQRTDPGSNLRMASGTVVDLNRRGILWSRSGFRIYVCICKD